MERRVAADRARFSLIDRAFRLAWREIETGIEAKRQRTARIMIMRAIAEAAKHGVSNDTALAEYAVLHYRQSRGVRL